MAKRNQDLQNLNHRHVVIAEWLVVNPDKNLTACARHFDYTLPWLSRMIHSDMFQAYYLELCKERKVMAVHTISNKMNHAAGLALDRMIDKLEEGAMVGERFVLDSANGLLDKLGYTSRGPEIHQHQHLHLSADDIKSARERAILVNASD